MVQVPVVAVPGPPQVPVVAVPGPLPHDVRDDLLSPRKFARQLRVTTVLSEATYRGFHEKGLLKVNTLHLHYLSLNAHNQLSDRF